MPPSCAPPPSRSAPTAASLLRGQPRPRGDQDLGGQARAPADRGAGACLPRPGRARRPPSSAASSSATSSPWCASRARRANGMPELHKLTPPLGVLQDRGFKVALVTDGRMSGASGKVPAAIHVTPEAAERGPLARLRDGDMVRLDAAARPARGAGRRGRLELAHRGRAGSLRYMPGARPRAVRQLPRRGDQRRARRRRGRLPARSARSVARRSRRVVLTAAPARWRRAEVKGGRIIIKLGEANEMNGREGDVHGLARNAMAYVLAGGRGSRLLELTDKRAKPAVFFGGKSRIIDFALSNAINSGIRRIGGRHPVQGAQPDPPPAARLDLLPPGAQRELRHPARLAAGLRDASGTSAPPTRSSRTSTSSTATARSTWSSWPATTSTRWTMS